MDERAVRVTQRLRDICDEFQGGEATLLDLSRVAAQVAMTLDNAHSDLLALLRAADGDLEQAYYATEREVHAATAERIFGKIVSRLDQE